MTDVYLELGDRRLLEAMDAQWASVHERKMYLTGAFGSRHRDEAFGDDYELPSDRAYAETCATVADLQWNWRMLLAGGRAGTARYAETMEREIYNALPAAVDETGTRFFYSNPLQLRPDRYSQENAPRERRSWYACACCPPNIARTFAQLSAYVASFDHSTVWIHQFAGFDLDLPDHLGAGMLRMRTEYPNTGSVVVTVEGDIGDGAHLAIRIPTWAGSVEVSAGEGRGYRSDVGGYVHLPLRPGLVTFTLPLEPRLTRAHPRVDAVRGCLAVERGPEVYCVESDDLPEGAELDDLRLVLPCQPNVRGSGSIDLDVLMQSSTQGLYAELGIPKCDPIRLTVPAVPFSTWGNRTPGAMRVWLPLAP